VASPRRPLPFDPIAEARRNWQDRWPVADEMAAATSLMRAQQIVLATVDRALADCDLTVARYEALVLLVFSRRGALPLGKMGDRLQIHPTSVTNIVDRLEAQGLVRRAPHPTDGRTTLAHITPEGRRVVEKATAAVTATGFGMAALSSRELKQLTELIRKVRQATGDFREGAVTEGIDR
jgi:DNA-binding MarR family transcriptional regulator